MLKLRTFVCLGRKCAVNVGIQNRNIILLSKRLTLAQLTFNAFFSLVITGITSINHTVHKTTSVRIVARKDRFVKRFYFEVLQ